MQETTCVSLDEQLTQDPAAENGAPFWPCSIEPYPEPPLKRALDVVLAAAGLVLLSPLFLVVSIAVKRYDGGPVFYRAVRAGKHGQSFRLYKFRTMVNGAQRRGPGITATGDIRITAVGLWLRRSKLDELPQLINVLLGQMSLVGPRPEDPRYVALYTREQREVLHVRPGMTSAASVAYRHEERMLSGADWDAVYRDRIMPAKLAIDLDYLTKRTLRSDMGIILWTVVAIFK